jgi:hypothetical protein
MSERDWHGWQKGRVALHIGHLPGRRSVCLYVDTGNVIEPVAYFRGPRGYEQAYLALAVLDYLMGMNDTPVAPITTLTLTEETP